MPFGAVTPCNIFSALILIKNDNMTISSICLYCGKPFEAKPYLVRKGYGKFCSKNCLYKYRHIHPNCPSTKIERTCDTCGKRFLIQPYKLKKKNFCSRECAWKSYRKNTGYRNANWKNGSSYGKYCEKFNNELKKRVRAFWYNECVICHATKNGNGKALHVHHVTYDKKVCCNGERPLFVPLCDKCHMKTQTQREEWEIWFKYYIWGATDGSMKTYFTKEEFEAW